MCIEMLPLDRAVVNGTTMTQKWNLTLVDQELRASLMMAVPQMSTCPGDKDVHLIQSIACKTFGSQGKRELRIHNKSGKKKKKNMFECMLLVALIAWMFVPKSFASLFVSKIVTFVCPPLQPTNRLVLWFHVMMGRFIYFDPILDFDISN